MKIGVNMNKQYNWYFKVESMIKSEEKLNSYFYNNKTIVNNNKLNWIRGEIESVENSKRSNKKINSYSQTPEQKMSK